VRPALLGLVPAVNALVAAGVKGTGSIGMACERPDPALGVETRGAGRPRPGFAEILAGPDRHADRTDVEIDLHRSFLRERLIFLNLAAL
jgi:hypothetical protein